MVFCNKMCLELHTVSQISHNPYFNRWFSAIDNRKKVYKKQIDCHNPYFNRWFSAILIFTNKKEKKACHNPYFNRWFSAIISTTTGKINLILSQSLF